MTLVKRILQAHPSESAGGAYRWYRPDLILLPEYALALFAESFQSRGHKITHPEKLLVVADHFAPPSTVERAEILRVVRGFCAERGLDLRLFEGICHQLLIEDARTRPGALIVGSDSHTITAGALGAFAVGFGGTDIHAALVTGKIALRSPESIRVELLGRRPKGVMGKDIILALMRLFGKDKMNYCALEFADRTEGGLEQNERFCICNMVVEGGGKAALFIPDQVTREALSRRDGGYVPDPSWEEALGDKDYLETHQMDLSSLEPMVARPPDPFDVVPVSRIAGLRLDQVFIGSCNAGRLSDLAVAAGILEGRNVAPGLSAIAVPGSRRVVLEALEAGYIKTLVSAGVTMLNPGCGPCGAIDKGLLAAGERCAATINRNYSGRMGSPDAEVYLVSPATAAASMITGRLSDPREVME